MKDLFFIPEWYLKKRYFRKKLILRIFSVFLAAINIILIVFYMYNLNRLNDMDAYINDINLKNQNTQYTKEEYKNKTLESFECLPVQILNNITSQSICIEDKNISITGYINESDGREKYTSIIKNIHNQNKFNIKNMYIPDKESKFTDFKIDLELK